MPEETTRELSNQVQELINTEKSYNAGLTLLNTALQDPSLTSANPILKDLKELTFSLKAISDRLYDNMQKGINIQTTFGERRILKDQREQITKAFFTTMVSYTTLFDTLQREMSTSPNSFKSLNQYIQKTANGQTLQALLITPIQRTMRYKLLMEEVQKTGLVLLRFAHLTSYEEIKPLLNNHDALLLIKDRLHFVNKTHKTITQLEGSAEQILHLFDDDYQLASEEALELLSTVLNNGKKYSPSLILEESKKQEALISDRLRKINPPSPSQRMNTGLELYTKLETFIRGQLILAVNQGVRAKPELGLETISKLSAFVESKLPEINLELNHVDVLKAISNQTIDIQPANEKQLVIEHLKKEVQILKNKLVEQQAEIIRQDAAAEARLARLAERKAAFEASHGARLTHLQQVKASRANLRPLEPQLPVEAHAEKPKGNHSPAFLADQAELQEISYKKSLRKFKKLTNLTADMEELVKNLLNQVESIKTEEQLPLLTRALKLSYRRITEVDADSTEFNQLVKEVQGHSSTKMKVLGGILLTLGILAAAAALIFLTPVIGGLIAAGATTAGILAGTGTGVLAASALAGSIATSQRFFRNGQQKGISLAMKKIDDELNVNAVLHPSEQEKAVAV